MMNTDAPDVTDSHVGGGRGISPTLDATLDLLSNRRRRYVLYYLREQGHSVTLEELAEQVASWERDNGDSPDEERVLADLYHSQIPRLADADAVTFDAQDGYVSLDDDDAPLVEYLDLAAREENVV
ncbi:hypothetical protein [Halorussus sp. MSC15.2]|uniref:DUF7344 domain-containing protein n=1 Tax=Halorussus sp. MSC15.2 TaxID=2283638 RepID=UPI0013D5BD34|nr:hypothetical protein [Halorussus sp. MSC15.2]NEU56533.1 hypothetical protein [Halorussus sp. MSC15.2]